MFLDILHEHPHIKTIDHTFLEPGHTHMECDAEHALIEKAKKRVGFSVQIPEDWYNIVRETKPKNPYVVVIKDLEKFFDFAELFTGPLVLRTTNCKKEKIVWQNIRWIKYSHNNNGEFSYKNCLSEKENFKKANFRRRNYNLINVKENLSSKYTGPNSISKEKK